jgi:hypothetical protein
LQQATAGAADFSLTKSSSTVLYAVHTKARGARRCTEGGRGEVYGLVKPGILLAPRRHVNKVLFASKYLPKF